MVSTVEPDNTSSLTIKNETIRDDLCPICRNEFKKRLIVFNNRKECFICNRLVCADCLSKEERFEPFINKKGYACNDCYSKTKTSYSSSLLPRVMDINAAVDSIETRIPEHLGDISNKLDEIIKVRVALEEIIPFIQKEVEDVKKFSENFTIKNWKIIKKDIYIIILVTGLGIFLLVGLIIIMTMLLIKYIYPIL